MRQVQGIQGRQKGYKTFMRGTRQIRGGYKEYEAGKR